MRYRRYLVLKVTNLVYFGYLWAALSILVKILKATQKRPKNRTSVAKNSYI